MKQNISLAQFTTFGIGGPAKYFTEVETIEELKESITFAMQQKLEILVIGGGSNVLISDEGFDGLAIRINNTHLSFDSSEVTAGAGLVWDELVKECIARNLQGIECLSGIPGSVGAAPVQNIGAYGQELKDSFAKLTAWDLTDQTVKEFSQNDCHFGYRDSIFKQPENKKRYIIWQVVLKLTPNAIPTLTYKSLASFLDEHQIKKPSLKQVREAVLEIRKQKHIDPKVSGNAGSFFKNPIIDRNDFTRLQEKFPDIQGFAADGGKVKVFAGWLIEKTGWKGKELGHAAVSPKHALIIINKDGQANAKDVADLADKIQQAVLKMFNIQLEKEVNFINI